MMLGMNNQQFDIVSGNVYKVFFYYAIPWVFGLLTISSASIVDGYFLGNYVGASALAAVNLAMPIISLLFAICIMLSVGGSVRCAKYIGEKDLKSASFIFSKTFMALAGFCFIYIICGMYFIDEIVIFLGAKAELINPTSEYLFYFFCFCIFIPFSVCLSFFARVAGNPLLASAGMILGSLANIVLDWLFIIHFDMGIKGAAMATGMAHIIGILLLGWYFASDRAMLRFSIKVRDWYEVLQASYNGLSELTNDMSVAIITLLFNQIMINRMGVAGVAGFTIVNFVMFVDLMVCYGISDAIQPLISTNFGAKKNDRISSFVKLALVCSFLTGVMIVILLFWIPDEIIGVFLRDQDDAVLGITLKFFSLCWPLFLFNGINLVFSAYFTGIHKPLQSALIAISRSLIFPGIFLLVLPKLWGNDGIYVALPLAEIVTVVLVVGLLLLSKKTANNR